MALGSRSRSLIRVPRFLTAEDPRAPGLSGASPTQAAELTTSLQLEYLGARYRGQHHHADVLVVGGALLPSDIQEPDRGTGAERDILRNRPQEGLFACGLQAGSPAESAVSGNDPHLGVPE